MRISDWSSDVCSSDLVPERRARRPHCIPLPRYAGFYEVAGTTYGALIMSPVKSIANLGSRVRNGISGLGAFLRLTRSEERRVGKVLVITFRSRWSPDP